MDRPDCWNLVGWQEMAREQGRWGRGGTKTICNNCIVLKVFFQHRAYIAKMQPIWDAEKAAAAAKANRETMIYLANATGTPIPADF